MRKGTKTNQRNRPYEDEIAHRKDAVNGMKATSPTSDSAKKQISIRACSRKNRVYVFREFLWETYGVEIITNELEKENLILDVAGGKGDLSWLLINADGAKSVVVDPRHLSSTSHLIRSVRWLEDHPEEATERAIPNRPAHQPLAKLIPQILERRRRRREEGILSDNEDFIEPQHLQLKADNRLVDALRLSLEEETAENECPKAWEIFYEDIFEEMKTSKTAAGAASGPCFLPESDRIQNIKPPIQDALEAWKIVKSVRLIAGFHPDQATEACVDLADLLQIPVCIVPCCVFPSEFPDRRLDVHSIGEDGNQLTKSVRVRDYDGFLEYLQQKQPNLRKATLAFHQSETSRNIVLYSLPEDIQR